METKRIRLPAGVIVAALCAVITVATYAGASGGERSFLLEGAAGDWDNADFVGAGARAHFKLLTSLYTQFDAAYGEIDDETRLDYALSLIQRGERGLVAGFAGYSDGDGLETRRYGVQVERYANDITTVVLTLGYEDNHTADDRGFGALLVRLYPGANVFIESGLAVSDDFGGGFDVDSPDLVLAIEAQPGVLSKWGVALFAEDGLDDLRTVGVRYYWGRGENLFDHHRDETIQRLRR